MENYKNGDKVIDILKEIKVTQPDNNIVSFSRLVLLDDPYEERNWIENFLILQDFITKHNNGYILQPIICRVEPQNKSYLKRLSIALPRITITLIHFNNSDRFLTYIGFPFPHKFSKPSVGLSIKSKRIYHLIKQILTSYIEGE